MKNFKTQEEFISQIKEPVLDNRYPLDGQEIAISDQRGKLKYKIEIGKLVGAGASCLVYEVVVDDLYPPKKNMILKEFFPNYKEANIVGQRDENNPLKVRFETKDQESLMTLVKDRKKFIESYDKHIKMIEIDPVLEDRIVRPYKLEKSDDYLFALYDTDKAQSVDKYNNLDLGRIIDILKQTSEILSFLHQKDIIYMDLKPANILYDYKRDRVKLFDFDAAIFLDELDNITEFLMPSERAFIPPELRYLSNINNRKEMFISEEIDLYMLGVTFFYLLMDRYPEDLENKNIDYLERNLREVLLKKSNRIFLNKITTDRIVDLLKESLSVHRYLSVNDFSQRLDEIQKGLDTSKNNEIANILSAAFVMESKPLYNYINEDENGKYIDIAMVGGLRAGLDFFSLLFASVDLADVENRFTFYTSNPKESYKILTDAMPLLRETTKISIEGKVVDDNINQVITEKSYASINFTKKFDNINEHYIIIHQEDGLNYTDLAKKLYDKFEDLEENRLIVNYSRYVRGVEVFENDFISSYNIDIRSAATFRNRDFSESILEEAYEIHKFYTREYGGERVDDARIWQNFIKDDLYSIKSSIRTALSMKYRIYMSGSYNKDDICRHFYDNVVKPGRLTDALSQRDIFADMEHHTWNRFMISQGYLRPSYEEFKKYAYVGSNNHVDKINKLHPLIVNTNIRKFKSGQDDEFELVSKKIQAFLLKKTKNLDQGVLERISHNLNNTNWLANNNLRELFPLWEELYNITLRLSDKEAYAINTLNQLISIIDERFEKDFLGKEDLLADYRLIKQDLKLLIESEKPKSFRDSDYMVIDAKPLIKYGPIKTIFAPFVADDELLWANVLAAIKYEPQNLFLIDENPEDHKEKFNKIVDFLKNKRQQKSMNIKMISYEDIKYYSSENAVADLTLNTHTDAKRPEIMKLPYVEYLGSNEWGGDYAANEFYLNRRTLTVEEAFFLNNAKFYNAASENNLARLSNFYEKLWQAYMDTDSSKWAIFTEFFRAGISQYIFDLSYPKKENSSMIESGNFIFKRDDKLKYQKLTSFLKELKDEDLLVDYKFPINPGRLKLESYNEEFSKNLGDFISENLFNYFEVFDLRKLYFPLLNEKAEKKFYCYAMSNNVKFSYKIYNKDCKNLAYELNNMMEDLDRDTNPDAEIRIFNHINGKDYVEGHGDYLEFNYQLGDIAFREFFEKGIALQIYTYFELIRKSKVFDEVKIDVRLKWQAYDDYSPLSEGVENHIDIVCTKEFSTFIITTTQIQLKKEDLYEIKTQAKQFGIDTKPILINTNSMGIDKSIRKIAKATGVFLIDREMIEKRSVVEYLDNIARADKNWQNIEI